MKNTVFIHTNAKQILGAHVAAHALRRNSANPDAFDVRIIKDEDFPFIAAYDGKTYLREGKGVVWEANNLQSFTPLRFAVPELMGYQGKAVVMDPDIFAIGDINDLFATDMKGAAILARPMEATDTRPSHFASSVMLLDCAKLTHWKAAEDFGVLFENKRDYRDWMWLLTQPPGTIGPLDPVWNDFDRLAPETRMLHNTNRRTQPWKTGLPVDFMARRTTLSARLKGLWRALKAHASGKGYAPNGFYKPHPDKAQEKLFFDLLQECLDKGVVTRQDLEQEIARRHVRPDAFQLVRA
ncbi:hypothetical protein ACFSM5_17050 [Lacibacterium aquatile]|uniref:Nucleotide-diphospho-sugar transferase domain-containing protein n=1 Tax=Lacibacterium aquatile TaxID=1168082 RepID=A0ABW5DVU3_9PROT